MCLIHLSHCIFYNIALAHSFRPKVDLPGILKLKAYMQISISYRIRSNHLFDIQQTKIQLANTSYFLITGFGQNKYLMRIRISFFLIKVR